MKYTFVVKEDDLPGYTTDTPLVVGERLRINTGHAHLYVVDGLERTLVNKNDQVADQNLTAYLKKIY